MVETAGCDRHLTVHRNALLLIKEKRNCEVVLDDNVKIGGMQSHEVCGDIGQKIGGNPSERIRNIYLKAHANVVVEAGSGITLKVGGNFVQIDASGVTILGSMVRINSSGGSAGSATAVALTASEAPAAADCVQPGRDKNCQRNDNPADGTPAETETSWIEIELVDEIGQPYVITLPDRSEITGSLDENVRTRLTGIDSPGRCQVKLPKLDTDV